MNPEDHNDLQDIAERLGHEFMDASHLHLRDQGPLPEDCLTPTYLVPSEEYYFDLI